MEALTSCLVNVDGINYKIEIKIQDGERIDLDGLKKYLSESSDEELSQFDIFNNEKYTIEIFDPKFQEYVQTENDVELIDRTRLRVRSVDKNKRPSPITNGHHVIEDEALVINDLEDKRELVNIVSKLYLDYVTPLHLRNRRRTSSHFHEESLKLKEKFWSNVADEMTIATSKLFTPDDCSVAFFGLLSQYQYILRKYKRYPESRAQEMWPFFLAFHHKIDCKLFSKGLTNLKNNFNTARKEGPNGGQSSKPKKSESAKLEEDFNLITSVLSRAHDFKKPPRALVWKTIGDDMSDYDTPNSRMAGFRWQKRFHELLNKYVQISSHGSQLDKETWPLYNLISQLNLDLFMKPTEGSRSRSKNKRQTRNNGHNSAGGSSPIPIDLSDSESEFVVIDEIEGSDRDTPCVDLEEEDDINECVQDLMQNLLNQVIGET